MLLTHYCTIKFSPKRLSLLIIPIFIQWNRIDPKIVPVFSGGEYRDRRYERQPTDVLAGQQTKHG